MVKGRVLTMKKVLTNPVIGMKVYYSGFGGVLCRITNIWPYLRPLDETPLIRVVNVNTGKDPFSGWILSVNFWIYEDHQDWLHEGF